MSLHLVHAWREGRDGEPGWCLSFQAWRDDFLEGVAALKAAVPATRRRYDPETHVWWIAEEEARELTALVPSLEAHLRQRPLL